MSSFIEQQYQEFDESLDDLSQNQTNKFKTAVRKLICSNQGFSLIFIILFACIVPISIYFVIFDNGNFPTDQVNSCLVNSTYRIHCGRDGISENDCISISCCYDNSTKSCYHYVPSYYYYEKSGDFYVSSKDKSPLGNETEKISLTVQEINKSTFKVILHEPSKTYKAKTINKKDYHYTVNDTRLGVNVYRNDNNDLILNTMKGPLIISKNYWEWNFQLTEDYLFGLGETLIEFENHNTSYTRVIYRNQKDHNSLPTFMAYKNGSFHGLTIYHEGPLEVVVLPSNLVTFKSIAGSSIELVLYLGPTPKDVVEQMKNGLKQDSVPNWVLGTHICRGGNSLDFDNILNEFKIFLNGSHYNYESDCIHENLLLMMLDDLTVSQQERLKLAVKTLSKNGKRFALSFPPQIFTKSSFYKSLNIDVFYKNNKSGSIYEGKYLENSVAYPDFTSENINKYIEKVNDEIRKKLELFPDAIILADNWPLDQSFFMDNISLPYLSKGIIDAMTSTLPWNLSTQNGGYHITNHNNYGAFQLNVLKNNSYTKNSVIFSVSNNFGINSPLIIENLNISWTNFKKAIRTSLYNSLFSSPLVGLPICGSTNHYDKTIQESLCIRWYLMASTMPLFRISSDFPRRDPNSLDSKFATNFAEFAIDIRSKLQGYFYTILNQHEPVIRPMFYDFYKNTTAFFLDEQYMIGNKLLIAQPVLPNTSKVRVYLPPEIEVWYEFWSGENFETKEETPWIDFSIVQTDWIAFVAQGSIIPLVKNENSVTNLELIVALNVKHNSAEGNLLIGSSIVNFTSSNSNLTITGILDAWNSMECNNKSYILQNVKLYNHKFNSMKVISNNLCQNINKDNTFIFYYN